VQMRNGRPHLFEALFERFLRQHRVGECARCRVGEQGVDASAIVAQRRRDSRLHVFGLDGREMRQAGFGKQGVGGCHQHNVQGRRAKIKDNALACLR